MRSTFSPISLGQTLRSVQAGGFVLTESAHPPTLTLPPHVHQFASLAVVLHGSYTEVVGGRPQQCDASSVIVKPAGELHSDNYGQHGARCLLIEVTPGRLETIRPFSGLFDRVSHLREQRLAALTNRIYGEFQALDSAAALSLEGLVLELLAQASRRTTGPSTSREPEWLRAATDLIHEQYAQPLRLGSVAESVGVHPAHLARVFRRHHRCTVGEYVGRLRLDQAMQELARGEQPLSEIALLAGFYDQSHFTRAFRLHTGLTPARFRAVARSRNARPKMLRFSKTA